MDNTDKTCSSLRDSLYRETKPIKHTKMSSRDKNLHQFLLHRHLLQNLSDNLGSLLVGREQFLALFALVLDGIVLIQELSEQILLVQLADKSVLDNILGVVDKQVHDCFGHLVCNRLSYDVEV